MTDGTLARPDPEELRTRTITRTLTAGGYEITAARREPQAVVVECQKGDLLGIQVPYVIAFWDADAPSGPLVELLGREADRQKRLLLTVARTSGPDRLSWEEFLEALGGAVPSWHALTDGYSEVLVTSSKNILPGGFKGEPWRVYEEAVADGLEFVLGRRVRRQGGARRGQRVGDVLAMTEDPSVFVVDAKASAAPFDASWPNLRPLKEYVERQQRRQRGQADVAGGLIVAREFQQRDPQLVELSTEFLRETCATLAFLDASVLLEGVASMANQPDLRTAVRWTRLFSGPGRVTGPELKREIAAANAERFPRDRRPEG